MKKILLLFFVLSISLLTCQSVVQAETTVTILHNNDGASQLVYADGNEDLGGVARYKFISDFLREEAIMFGPALLLSSGGSFLAGPEFSAGIADGIYYDAMALDYIGYDAICFGNHDFDFGPNTLAEFIQSFEMSSPPYLCANADFTNEANLQNLVDAGRISPRAIVENEGVQFGIVGAIAYNLPFISSPGTVDVHADIASYIQAHVDTLTEQNIDKIIVISHLQDIGEDLEIASLLRNVDILIAGGGNELLANEGDLLIPGDEELVYGEYPMTAQDADDNPIYVVTTTGGYRYVGRLIVTFDDNGVITAVGEASGPVRVVSEQLEGGFPVDDEVEYEVVAPVRAYLEALAENVIASSEVPLDGRRNSVHTFETNQGDLMADAMLWQANQLAGEFDAPNCQVAILNGGGIRNDVIIAAGDITELNTFDMAPFANFVSVVTNFPADQFKNILENAVCSVSAESDAGTGRFAQISGFHFEYDTQRQERTYDNEGNVIEVGNRVLFACLDNGDTIIANGSIVENVPDINIATINFLAGGSDQYPFNGAEYINLGVTYQQMLVNYMTATLEDGGLNGVISSEQYPEGGVGRIIRWDGDQRIPNDFEDSQPVAFALGANYPNPFNPSTKIPFTVSSNDMVKISVFDVAGREIAVIANGNFNAGSHVVNFDANGLANGQYIVKMNINTMTSSRAITLMR